MKLGACLIVAGMLASTSGAAWAAEVAHADGAAGLPPQPPARTAYQVGDKLKLSFYEPLTADPKWASKPQSPGPSFYLHTELSGEFVVDSDWTISIPLLGSVVVAGRNPDEVQADLTRTFEQIVGHRGFITITIVERKPLYVVGLVKTPGVYKFASGLTPLNLVALAGGVPSRSDDKWAVVEAVRQAGKEKSELDRLRRVLAQYAVLQAEINDTAVQMPDQLVELSDRQHAEKLVSEEQARRRPLVQARKDRVRALGVAIDTAQHALEIDSGRLAALQDSIDLRQARLDSLQTLFRNGRIAQVVVDQAQAELVDTRERRAGVMASMAEGQQRLALAKIDATKFDTDTKADLDQLLANLQREIDELTPAAAATAGVLRLLSPSASEASSDALSFSIVRNGEVLPADLTTTLQPGDVLRVEADRPATTRAAPPDQALPRYGSN